MADGVTPQQNDAGSVSDLVQMFEEAEQTTSTARKLSERDRDYYDGKQWTAEALPDRVPVGPRAAGKRRSSPPLRDVRAADPAGTIPPSVGAGRVALRVIPARRR